MRKHVIYNFLFENNHKKRTVAIYLLTAFYRMQILLIPSKYLEKKWGERGKESEATEIEANYRTAYFISKDVNRIADKTPWKSLCLVRALAARYLMVRKGIPTTLYLGVGKDENGKMIAHAWLRCGEMYMTGGDGSGYAMVAKFCK